MNVYRSSLIIQFLITVLLGIVLINLSTAGGVHAQDQTLLMIEPSGSNVGVDGLVTLTVEIVGGQDLIAYDLTINYDAEVVALESWAQGSYFKQLAVIKNDNQPGSLRLAATQVGVPAVSGDGTILTLVFRGTNPGTALIELERADLVKTSGQLANVVTYDSEIVVSSDQSPTLEPTLTFTPTRTSTPTLTRTIRVPTATRTATIPLVASQTQVDAAAKTPVTQTVAVSRATVTGANTTMTPAAAAPLKTATRSGSPALTGEIPAGEITATHPGSGQPQVTTPQPADLEGDRPGQTALNTILWATALFLLVMLIGMGLYYMKNRN